jgi:hypothetical protein
MSTTLHDAESAILERAITADNQAWSPEASRAILDFKLADADLRHADELAAKARAGSLTANEQESLDHYIRIGRLVEFMKARALLSLKASGSAA